MPRRALLVYNPAAGRRGRARDEVRRALERGGWELSAVATEAPGHAAELARCGVTEGAEAVFALGGDGTLREAATGLLDPPTVPLGLLPGGTANVLTRALGMPGSPLEAAEMLAVTTVREAPIDVGDCAGRPFLMMVSAGLDARALAALSPVSKRRWGRVAIAAAGWRALLAEQPPIGVAVAGERFEAGFVAVCNVPLYGGPFRLEPAARCDDRRLDLVAVRSRRRRALLGFALGVLLGRPRRWGVERRPAGGIALDACGADRLELQIDGDPLTLPSPVTVRLDERRLRVLLPG